MDKQQAASAKINNVHLSLRRRDEVNDDITSATHHFSHATAAERGKTHVDRSGVCLAAHSERAHARARDFYFCYFVFV